MKQSKINNFAKVFLLTGNWGDYNGRNVLKFIGVSEELGAVEIIISNNKPVFFIERNAAINVSSKSFLRKETSLKCFSNKSVDALYFYTQKDLLAAAEQMAKDNITTYESDVDPLRRFLMEKFINSQMLITGDSEINGKLTRFINPKVEPCNVTPIFKVASMDIETNSKTNQLYSIAVHITGKSSELKKVFMLNSFPNQKQDIFLETVSLFGSETELLSNFFSWFNDIDPDIIIGWHVIGFDLLFLENKCRELGLNFDMARGHGQVSIRHRKSGGYYCSVTGRVVIDGPSTLRASFFNFEDFKLETVAQELLGVGKTISPDENKVDEINRLFSDDKNSLAEYNMQDAVLVTNIFNKTGLLELSIKRSQISGLLMDQLGMMTAAFDHFYLPKLHRAGFVAPNLKDITTTEHAAGGYVIEPTPGIYENVVVLDFKSLYPSIIQSFKIDPYSLLMKNNNTIKTLNGYEFSSSHHILPDFIEELMGLREKAKLNSDKPLSQAIKILMNSFYGVMGSYGCRFYHPDLPRAITGSGHKLLLCSKVFLELNNFKVIYGDTDSLFVMIANDVIDTKSTGNKIAYDLNQYWNNKLEVEYNVKSHLEIEFEKYYKKFIITPARGADTGAKKRYAGLTIQNGKERIEFVGLEFVRSDWTKLAKEFQIELYKKVFNGDEVDEWIREVISDLRNGKYDSKLIYKKRLRKEVDTYIKNIPPHVKAAKMLHEPQDVIYYAITQRGAIPVELKHNDFDYQHYIEKQLKPIADSILYLLNKNFDEIAGTDQLNFFN